MSNSHETAAPAKAADLVHATVHASLKDDVFGGADTELLSVSQAAQLLQLSEKETIKLVEREVLCAKRDITGKRWLVQRECVLAQVGIEAANDFKVLKEQEIGENLDSSEYETVEDVEATGDFEPIESVELSHGINRNAVDASDLGDNITNALDYIFAQSDFIGTAFNTEEDGTMTEIEVEEEEAVRVSYPAAVEAFDREAITNKHVEEIIQNLDVANVRLEGAMYRIGYLEAQVDSYEEQLKVLPEFRMRAAKAILVDRENDIMKEQVAKHEAAVTAAYELIEKLHTSRWYRFWAWVCGVAMPARPLPKTEEE